MHEGNRNRTKEEQISHIRGGEFGQAPKRLRRSKIDTLRLVRITSAIALWAVPERTIRPAVSGSMYYRV